MHYFGSKKILKISNTLKVITDCWGRAEESLQVEIREDYPGVNEEFITQMFHGKLARALREASKKRLIEKAFLIDLQKSFPELSQSLELRKIAYGLIADVTLHRKDTECVTGGDMGFLIVRPQINDHVHALHVGSYRCGLLCQAKIKRADGTWGNFSRNQKKVLSERLRYLAMLLYRYEDKERRLLNQFQWQLCNEASTINDVSKWLRRDSFPSIVYYNSIIESVGNGKVGTHNDTIIDNIIAPTGNPALMIIINWPEDDHPGSKVHIYSKRKVKNHILVYIRQ